MKVIHGNIEKALNLRSVQVHRQHAVGTGGDEEVGHELRGDRHARLVLAVLARIAKIGEDGRDAIGRSPTRGVNHNQQLHQHLVGLLANRLHEEEIGPAHIVANLAPRLAIREMADIHRAQRGAHARGNLLGQRLIRRP